MDGKCRLLFALFYRVLYQNIGQGDAALLQQLHRFKYRQAHHARETARQMRHKAACNALNAVAARLVERFASG